ncbi:MAG: sigma-54-dependent Fis family transcriptional regulator [Fibrobacter sp.]|nr:sigma-54-dependent Fis family transcriptional regulator [Fibrobacter sp.]
MSVHDVYVAGRNEIAELENVIMSESGESQQTPQSPIFFGTSPAMVESIGHTKIAAKKDSVVLLLGETGTGKSVIARWIHDNSSRKGRPFVSLNCSSLRGDLLRSELYGHARGAFTSAIRDRAGLIESADGGTLFLDEIGEMDLGVQAELLKLIEEKSFRRIGDDRLRYSNFRLICATNRDLMAAIASGSFRLDLFYRICVFPINLPPLRKRKEELPSLIEHILKGLGYTHVPLQSDVLNLLVRNQWHGNIRELKNVLERAILLSDGSELTKANFFTPELPAGNESDAGFDTWDLAELEKRHILAALKHFNGDKNKASLALGISLSSLYRKIETYNVNAI